MSPLARVALLFLAPAGLWWLLAGADPASWVIGIPAILAAGWSAARLRASSGSSLSVAGLLLFLPYFFWESLRGGTDVMLRTLAPRVRIAPDTAEYRMTLRSREARVFFANCLCLLPGTLAADLRGERIDLHLLDAREDSSRELRRLERAVARVYSESI